MIKNTTKFFSLILVFLSVFVVVPKASALTITPVRLEIAGNPGEVLTKEITLFNDRTTDETYYVSYANFEAQGETGDPAFVDAKEGLGTWMQTSSSISIPAKTSQTVTIKINIPENAEPGGNFGAIFWGTLPPNPGGNAVTIGAKIGLLVLLRVNGQVNEQGGVIEFFTKNKQKFYTSLPVSFYYRFQNLGGDRIKPKGELKIKNVFGLTTKKLPGNPVDGNILPNSIRKFEIVWQGKDGPNPLAKDLQGGFFKKVGYEWRNFALGYYNAKLSLNYGLQDEVTKGSFSFWVFPWHLMIVILILLVLIYLIGQKLLKNYHRWVIGKAKEMLRKEAQDNNGNYTEKI
jgi:hypothetical protein